MLNHDKRMVEFALPKDDEHDFMQVYMDDPTIGVVSFYHGARASTDTVEFFAGYQTWFEVCAFYRVPYSKIEAYLKSVGIE